LSTRGRRFVFAVLVAVLGLLASVAIGAFEGGGAAMIMPFFPAVLVVTLYAGVGPAVGCGLFALITGAMAWGRSVTHPVLTSSQLWALGVFAAAAAVSIAICAHARRAAFEAALLVLERRAENAASRAARTKDELLSRLSHELRTPLSAIIGWAQVLRAQTPPEQVAHGLEVIERNARAQTRIIEDLIDAKPGGAENETPNAPGVADHPRGNITG
jgi:signal transduction histidine kinase